MLPKFLEFSLSERRRSLRRINALVVKEFHQIIRDPSSILISVVLPTLLMFIYGFGVSLDLDHLRIGLALEDTSPTAISFATAMTNSRYFDVHIARDHRELVPKLVSGGIRGIVVIPSYFSAFQRRPDNIAPIQVIADGSETNTASFVQNYVSGAWQDWQRQEAISSDLKGSSLINVQTRFWYNEQLESRNFLLPGSLAIIMTLIGTLLTALVVTREWERGTMEALMTTPVTIGELLIGKTLPYFTLGMGSMAICVTIAIVLYDVPFRGSWILLALVTAVFLLTALGLGLLISTTTRSQFVASQNAIVAAFLPSYILSGFIFEIYSMPLVIQWITYFVPARYFVSSLLTLFLVGNVWQLLIYNFLPMIAVGSLFFTITALRTAKRLD